MIGPQITAGKRWLQDPKHTLDHQVLLGDTVAWGRMWPPPTEETGHEGLVSRFRDNIPISWYAFSSPSFIFAFSLFTQWMIALNEGC